MKLLCAQFARCPGIPCESNEPNAVLFPLAIAYCLLPAQAPPLWAIYFAVAGLKDIWTEGGPAGQLDSRNVACCRMRAMSATSFRHGHMQAFYCAPDSGGSCCLPCCCSSSRWCPVAAWAGARAEASADAGSASCSASGSGSCAMFAQRNTL